MTSAQSPASRHPAQSRSLTHKKSAYQKDYVRH
ncbi:Uncharacterised protein [Vibrio cholerae]|nr:Uncharacterised protein [Vibrio cholerae]